MTAAVRPSAQSGLLTDMLLLTPSGRTRTARGRIETTSAVVPELLIEVPGVGALRYERGRSEPSWLSSALSRLSSIAMLADDWDSYGARGPSQDAVFTAVFLLHSAVPPEASEPAIVPTVEGGVQLEWRNGIHTMEVTIDAAGGITTAYEDEGTGTIVEDQHSLVSEYLSQLLRAWGV